MSWLLAVTMLAAPPVETPVESLTVTEVVERVEDLPTGALIFSKGDCLAVRIYTQSRFTHVAAVVKQDGEMMVYDSTQGDGVRRQPLCDYLDSACRGEVEIVKPSRPLTATQRREFSAALKERLGRPYSVNHFLTGKRCSGLHCSEYVTDALMAAGVMHAHNPPRVSPASLHVGIHQKPTYQPVLAADIKEPQPERSKSWCGQTWQDTKQCTKRCYLKLRGWFCCY